MHLICFDEATLKYRRIGEVVGNAFVEGNKIRKG
jgi:hypothetical protein